MAGCYYGSEEQESRFRLVRDLSELFRKHCEEPPLGLRIVGISSYSQGTGIFPTAVSRKEESRPEKKVTCSAHLLLCCLVYSSVTSSET